MTHPTDPFDAATPPSPSQTALNEIRHVAACEAFRVQREKKHAAWLEECEAWNRLACAAYACYAILVMRHLSFVVGEPEQEERP